MRLPGRLYGFCHAVRLAVSYQVDRITGKMLLERVDTGPSHGRSLKGEVNVIGFMLL